MQYDIQPGQSLLHFDNLRLKPGDIVNLLPGEHDLRPFAKQFHASGTADNPIILRGQPGAYITREGKGGWQYGLWIIGQHYRIENVECRWCAQSGIHIGGYKDGAGNWAESGHVTVRGCTFDHCGQGVWIEGPNVTVEDSHARDGIMTINTAGGDDDYGASFAMVKASNVTIRNCTAVNMLAPSKDYTYDGSFVEFFLERLPITDVLIEDCAAYVCNTFMEVGGWKGSSQHIGRVTLRNNRMWNPEGGRISNGAVWNNFQMYTIHEGGGFGVRLLNEPGTLLISGLEVWNTTRKYHYPITERVKIEGLDQRTGHIDAVEFLQMDDPTPDPDPDPTPDPDPVPVPDTHYLLPRRFVLRLQINGQTIDIPGETLILE